MNVRVDRSRLKSIRVLLEDDGLIAVSKPAEMSVHGGAGEPGPTLIELMQAACGGAPLHLVNRLDRATSGIVLIAKNAELAGALAREWPSAEKRYIAVVLGRLAKTVTIDDVLEDKHGLRREASTRVEPRCGLKSVTPETSLISISIATGRMHQIRLHLRTLGHPVLMDDKHGDFKENKTWSKAVREAGAPRPKGAMLHARELTVLDPRTNQRVQIGEKPPESWVKILQAAGADVDVLEELS